MAIKKIFNSIPELTKMIHFDVNKPENHNVYISNMRDNFILIYDGNDWQLKDRSEILDQIIQDKSVILEEKFNETISNLSDYVKNKFKQFLEIKDDDVIINRIKKELKIMLYNNNKICKKQIKLKTNKTKNK